MSKIIVAAFVSVFLLGSTAAIAWKHRIIFDTNCCKGYIELLILQG